MDPQPLRNPPGFCRRESLVQRRRVVRVRIVENHSHRFAAMVGFLYQQRI